MKKAKCIANTLVQLHIYMSLGMLPPENKFYWPSMKLLRPQDTLILYGSMPDDQLETCKFSYIFVICILTCDFLFSFKFGSDGTVVDENEIPFGEDNVLSSDEECLTTTIQGYWYDVPCTKEKFPLCQMEGMYQKVIRKRLFF